jgi:hypothetical protein
MQRPDLQRWGLRQQFSCCGAPQLQRWKQVNAEWALMIQAAK